jgi:hypothetical protein
MKYNLPVFAALAISLMSSASVASLKASEFDKKTIITISQPVAVQGTILPAGQYVLRLQDLWSTRDLVNIFNGDETRLIATVHPIHAFRQEPADKSDFTFYDSPAGQPNALRTWFYPGDPNGFEFVRTQPVVAAASSAAPATARKTPARLPQHTVAADPHAAGG